MQPELAEYLRRFYGDLASKSGEEYSKSSLINIRAGLNKHVTSPPWNLQIMLMHDRTFQSANQVFNRLLRDYRVRGMDKSQHNTDLTATDVDRQYTTGTLSNKTRVALLHKVYFELSLHCARRGCAGLLELSQRQFYDSQRWEWSSICNFGIPWAGEDSSGLGEEWYWSWSSNVWAARWWELSRTFLWEVSVEAQSWMHWLFPEAKNRI